MLAKSDRSILPDGRMLLINGSQANLKKSDNKIAAIIPIQIAFISNLLKLKKISAKVSLETYFKNNQTTNSITIG
jgi:hypothetical protein